MYLNDGSGNFSEKTDHGLPDLGIYVLTSYVDSADVDGDDDLDLVISIFDASEADPQQSQLWLNDGDGSFVLSTSNDFPFVRYSLADFVDLDMDGDQDLILRGRHLDNRLWINDGTGVFTQKLDESLAEMSFNGMVIFDVDGDGDPDIYDSNTEEYSTLYTVIYFNDGSGSFAYDLSSELPRVDGNSSLAGTHAKAIDIDNDGDLDLMVEGKYGFDGAPPLADYIDVWLNNGFGHFRPLGSRTLSQVYPTDPYQFGRELGYGNYSENKTLSVYDFNGDGRQDILLSGTEFNGAFEKVTRILSNSELSNELVLEACNSYEFDGTDLTSSGNYQGAYTDEYGTSFSVNLDLTINSCFHWSGATDTDWFQGTNWEEGTVPEITDNVIINTSSNDPVILGDAAVHDLTIESGAILTIESGSALNIQGTVDGEGYAIVKRNTTGDKGYSIIGSMVEDAVVEDVEADYIYTFDGDDYHAPSNSETMEAGKGYFAAFNETSPSVDFYGKLNSGDQSYDLPSADKFHLVANPYAAPVNHSELVAGNTSFDGTIYLWDDGGSNSTGTRDGGYVTVNAAGIATGVGGLKGKDAFNGNIGSSQGFFIYADEATSINFTPSMQSTTTGGGADGAFYRTAPPQYIRLSLSNGSYKDDLVVMLQEGATDDFDSGLDARKLKNPNLSFFSLMEGEELSIQAISNDFDEAVIPLAYEVVASGEYTIRVDELENLPSHLEISLLDLETGTEYNLRSQDQIEVGLSMTHSERQVYSLVIRAQVLGEGAPDQETIVYADESLIKVLSDQSVLSFSVFDLNGRVVNYQEGVNAQEFSTAQPPQPGVYVIRLELENGKTTHKIVIE